MRGEPHPWESLPPELFRMVVSHVDLSDMLRVAAVCTRWRDTTIECVQEVSFHGYAPRFTGCSQKTTFAQSNK